MIRPVDGNPRITSKHGQPGSGHFGKHLGVDYAVNGVEAKAPAGGVVTRISQGPTTGPNAGIFLYFDANGKSRRFGHLKSVRVKVGQKFSEGEVLGTTGATSGYPGAGPHLHYDVRKLGTAWNDSFSNYIDPEAELAEANKPQPTPPTSSGKRLYFDPIGQIATFYPVKGGEYKMKIADPSYNWSVLEDQGYRVRVNSKSAGGDCWVYIIYQTGAAKGQRIPGRQVR